MPATVLTTVVGAVVGAAALASCASGAGSDDTGGGGSQAQVSSLTQKQALTRVDQYAHQSVSSFPRGTKLVAGSGDPVATGCSGSGSGTDTTAHLARDYTLTGVDRAGLTGYFEAFEKRWDAKGWGRLDGSPPERSLTLQSQDGFTLRLVASGEGTSASLQARTPCVRRDG